MDMMIKILDQVLLQQSEGVSITEIVVYKDVQTTPVPKTVAEPVLGMVTKTDDVLCKDSHLFTHKFVAFQQSIQSLALLRELFHDSLVKLDHRNLQLQ